MLTDSEFNFEHIIKCLSKYEYRNVRYLDDYLQHYQDQHACIHCSLNGIYRFLIVTGM